MKKEQVKEFWAIYRSSSFKKEIKNLFNKIHSYKNLYLLDQQYSRKNVSLIANCSPSFVTKALNLYNLFIASSLQREIKPKTQVSLLIIRVPKFHNLFVNLKNSRLTVQDFLNLSCFWDVPIQSCGPKNFAYLYYCLQYHGLSIRRVKWCKK